MALTDISHPTDIAMLTDLYELTMAQGLWESGKANEQGCFTAFYRDHPFGSAYAVMCGTAELPELVENLRFTPEDIDYLASLQAPAGGAMFKPGFLDYLRNFRAHVNIDAVPEGELVFPREPMVRVTGPALECQLLETALLNIVGFQTLVATKTARVVLAADGRPVAEFGLRRAQGPDGGLAVARASAVFGRSIIWMRLSSASCIRRPTWWVWNRAWPRCATSSCARIWPRPRLSPGQNDSLGGRGESRSLGRQLGRSLNS